MKRMKLLIALLLLLACKDISAQSVIKGTVKDNDGNLLEQVSVQIMPVNRTVLSDKNGEYNFAGLSKGKYILSFSFIGYQQTGKSITLEEGETRMIHIQMAHAIEELQHVEILGRRETGYKNANTFIATKTATSLRDIPQSISYVTKEVIDDQLAFKTSDAIKNISGVNQASYNNSDFVLRGFRSSSVMVNGLRISTRGWSQNLLPYVERLEVIKGPASALFANTDPGGTLNTVTKKPLDESRKAISFVTGSYNTYRIGTDFTGPMNQSKTLLYRLNLSYQNAQSFRVLQEGDAMVIAPSISFIPDDKTRINFDLVYQKNNGRLDRGQPIFGATAGTDLYSTPTSFAIGRRNDYQKELNLFSTISVQRKITDQISFNASYMKSMYDEDLLEHRTSNSYGVDADGKTIPTLMGMQTIRRLRKNYVDNLTTYFTANVRTGIISHKLLVGYDHIEENFPVGNSTYNANGFLSADGKSTISTYKVADKAKYLIVNNMPVPNVPYFNLANPDYSISEISKYINVSAQETPSKYFVNGVYVQEQLSIGKWQVLLGLRQEYYVNILNYTKSNSKNVKQSALIPRIGIVYTPVSAVSLYGTYTEGYQPQSAATIGDPATYGGPFDPLISNMVEAGAKMDLFQKRMTFTVAAYRIAQNNILKNAGAAGNPDLLEQIGQQQSKGIEVEMYGKVLPNLSLTANYAYNVTKITKSEKEVEIGKILPNAPKSQGGIWAKYTFTGKAVKGLGIAAGSNFATVRATDSNILTLPGYVVCNTALSYTVDKFKIAVNLNNVLNKTYWVGGFDYNRLFPGTPRNLMASLGYTF
jgi:iron complex outermembrane receptor protein